MDIATSLRAFVRTVERGSMTAAASDLRVSQPAISKLVGTLEAHTGAKLLERNRRAVRPTSQGLALYEVARNALAAIDAAIEDVRSTSKTISGTLRLHGPTCVGERHLNRIVSAFQDRHPAVVIDMTLENRPVDLIHENIDVAVRMGRPTDPDLMLRRIGFSRRILVASAGYLALRGPVRTCGDLEGHDLVVTNASLRGNTLPLRCADGKTEVTVRPKLITNNAQVLVDALLAGRGVGTAQVLLVSEELKSGRLIRVLPEHEIDPTELFLVYSSSKFLRPAVRAFVDFAFPALKSVNGIF